MVFAEELKAPCGINCGVCSAHLRTEENPVALGDVSGLPSTSAI